MNYKMMGKFIGKILIIEAGFMIPALFIIFFNKERRAVIEFGIDLFFN